MSLVEVFAMRDPKVIDDETWSDICNKLPDAISGALDVPDSGGEELDPDGVVVHAIDHSKFSVNTGPMNILILAKFHPARRTNTRERAQQIDLEIKEYLPQEVCDRFGPRSTSTVSIRLTKGDFHCFW